MPRYLDLHAKGELTRRAKQARELLSPCRCCPRQCGVDRLNGETGLCLTGNRALIASYNPHFGEEAPLVGQGGSGTIFFAGCNLLCCFCQNYDISHSPNGLAASPEQLAGVMLELQTQGVENINFVTPSHVAPQIVEALPLAADLGLNLPLVYNSSGYDSLETLTLLDGVMDIYMPDVKFWDSAIADRYCRAPDYPERARQAVKAMHGQVGDLCLDSQGVAVLGLLVRHLVMPDNGAGTADWMEFLAQEISTGTYINIMDQYRPCGEAQTHPELMRSITPQEYDIARSCAAKAGLARLDDRTERQVYRLMRALLGPGGS